MASRSRSYGLLLLYMQATRLRTAGVSGVVRFFPSSQRLGLIALQQVILQTTAAAIPYSAGYPS